MLTPGQSICGGLLVLFESLILVSSLLEVDLRVDQA